MKRPNILFITADQHRADCLGIEGRNIKTPHLDKIAREGTRFSTCMTPNPVCQPARASILTGMLPLTNGVYDNGVDLDPQKGEAGFAGQLGQSGYNTALFGKAHFSTKATFHPTGRPECQFSSAEYGPDWFGPYMGFDHVEMTDFGHWHKIRPTLRPPQGLHFEKWFFDRKDGEDNYKLWAEGETVAAQTWYSKLPVACHSTSWITDRTIKYLHENKDRDNPFCIWTSYPDPHHPFDCPEPWSRLHAPEDIDLSKYRVKDFEKRPWWHEASLNSLPDIKDPILLKFRKEGSRIIYQSDEELAYMMSNYYGMISLIDHGVGQIMLTLEDLGLAENTIIVYSSDHGDMLGDHGLYLKGPTPYEGILRVPLIFKGPGIPENHIISKPVSTLDLASTFYDYCQVQRPDDIQSESLRPLLEDRENSSRDTAYSEWNLHPSRCGIPLELRTVRTKTHKLTLELVSGAGEMYDLENDPNEMKNLFDDTAYKKKQKELVDLIHQRPGKKLDVLDEPVGMS